jgi:hypothetical protein
MAGPFETLPSLLDAEVEIAKAQKAPSNETPQKKDDVIDQRQRHIESDGVKRLQKQPGQDLRDPNMDDDDGE